MSLKRFGLMMVLSAVGISGPVLGIESQSLIKQVEALPEEFREHFFGTPVSARVLLDKKVLGDAMIILSNENAVQILNFTDSYDSDYSESERQEWQSLLAEFVPLGQCRSQCPKQLLAISYNLETAQLALVSSQGSKTQEQWLTLDGEGSYGLMLGNQFHLSAQSEQSPSMGWLMDMQSSIGEWSVLGQGQLDRTHDSELHSSVTALYAKRQLQGHYVRAGLFTPDSMGVLRQPVTNGGRLQTMIGAMFGSSDTRYIKDNSASLYPVYVTANRESVAEVYRNGLLINSQTVPPGLQTLDTSLFPAGVYDVEIRLLEDGREVNRLQDTVHKPLEWSNTQQRYKYNLFAGKTTDWLSDYQSTTAHEMMLGGNLNYLIDSSLVAGLALHSIGSELKKGLSLDWQAHQNFKWYGSVHHSNQSGYGFETQTLWQYQSGSLIFNHSQRWTPVYEEADRSERLELNKRSSLALNHRLSGYSSLNARVSLNQHEQPGYELRFGTRHTLWGTDVDWRLSLFDRPYSSSDSGRNWGGTLNASFALGNERRRGSVSVGSRSDAKGERDLYLSANIDQQWERGPFSSSSATLTADQYGLGVSGSGQFDSSIAAGSLWAQYGSQQTLAGGINLSNSVVFGQGEAALSHHMLRDGAGLIIDVDSDDPDVNLMAYYDHGATPLHAGRNVVPVKAWQPGKVELGFAGNDGPALHVWPNQMGYQLNRGGVNYHQVRVMETVTVMGRITDGSGMPQPGVRVINHAGRSVTEHDGFFTLEMHAHNPVVSIEHPNGKQCDVVLDKARDALKDIYFAGDLACMFNS
ncbi:CS1-pili formation C-terminal domain-containing protein [Amphritea sp.]|uniref:CS1-pili formation C-terminal domain-containing protein n=1 Tax=Amphritea sp. TaxID=1872502 RepID=UPI003A8CD148